MQKKVGGGGFLSGGGGGYWFGRRGLVGSKVGGNGGCGVWRM